MAERYVFGPFPHEIKHAFSRADLEFYGIDHFKPTYTARIYFNDRRVTAAGADEKRQTYAGKFVLLGHERCYGDVGHCDVPKTVRRFDTRPSHPLTPAFRRVVVTKALKRAVRQGKTLTITVIVESRKKLKAPARSSKPAGHGHGGRLFVISGMQLVTFA